MNIERIYTQIRVVIYHIGQLYVHDIWRKCFGYTIGLWVNSDLEP